MVTELPTLSEESPTQDPQDGVKETNRPNGDPEPPDTGKGQASDDEPTDIALHERWRDHPDVKSALAEEYSKGQSHRDRSAKREIAELDARRVEDIDAARKAAVSEAFVQRAFEALDKIVGDADPEAAGKWLDQHKEWAALMDRSREAHWTEGGKKLGRAEFATAMSQELYEGLGKEAAEELGDLATELNLDIRRGKVDMGSAFKQLFAKSLELREKEMEAKITARIEKQVRERLSAESKAAERQEGKPPAKVAGGGTPGSTFNPEGKSVIEMAKAISEGRFDPAAALRQK